MVHSMQRAFARSAELIITAMDISICFADFPTQAIGDTTRAYRQLGIGYANLGALLMASGLAYDSEGGRALAGAITSLMSGVTYKRSAETSWHCWCIRWFRTERKATCSRNAQARSCVIIC
jgi:ribonucleotide reductase alpha subunit